jgi:hypothetical protein
MWGKGFSRIIDERMELFMLQRFVFLMSLGMAVAGYAMEKKLLEPLPLFRSVSPECAIEMKLLDTQPLDESSKDSKALSNAINGEHNVEAVRNILQSLSPDTLLWCLVHHRSHEWPLLHEAVAYEMDKTSSSLVTMLLAPLVKIAQQKECVFALVRKLLAMQIRLTEEVKGKTCFLYYTPVTFAEKKWGYDGASTTYLRDLVTLFTVVPQQKPVSPKKQVFQQHLGDRSVESDESNPWTAFRARQKARMLAYKMLHRKLQQQSVQLPNK